MPLKEREVNTIKVVYHPAIQKEYVAEAAEALSSLCTNLEIKAELPGPQGAWEWILPAAVMLYISKGLVDGFLKELGGDAAKGLKRGLSKLFGKAKEPNIRWGTQDGSREPIPAAILSIEIELDDVGTRAKFVLPAQLNERQFLAALDKISEIMPAASAHQQRRIERLEEGKKTRGLEEAINFDAQHHEQLYPEKLFAFPSDRLEWIDAHEELKQVANKQMKDRKQKAVKQNSKRSKKK